MSVTVTGDVCCDVIPCSRDAGFQAVFLASLGKLLLYCVCPVRDAGFQAVLLASLSKLVYYELRPKSWTQCKRV